MPLGVGSGAGVIFGATGGVMEAALRTAYFVLEGHNPDPDAFAMVRGMDGIKETELTIAGIRVRAAVAHGLGMPAGSLRRSKRARRNMISLRSWHVPADARAAAASRFWMAWN